MERYSIDLKNLNKINDVLDTQSNNYYIIFCNNFDWIDAILGKIFSENALNLIKEFKHKLVFTLVELDINVIGTIQDQMKKKLAGKLIKADEEKIVVLNMCRLKVFTVPNLYIYLPKREEDGDHRKGESQPELIRASTFAHFTNHKKSDPRG